MMPFRYRQSLDVACSGKIFYQVATPNPDTGIVETKDVSQQDKLPDAGLFDLSVLLKAGVNLQKVSCKRILSDEFQTANFLESIKVPENDNSSDKE